MADFTPITFTKTDPETKRVYELTAHSPSDEVKFRFDGWTVKGAKTTTKTDKTTDSK